MGQVFVISDLHFGHKRIVEFGHRVGPTVKEHDAWLVDAWKSTVDKRDMVFVLGDVAMTKESLAVYGTLPGYKKLVLGNHDNYPVTDYMAVFGKIMPGLFNYKTMWMSHAPIHPNELYARPNVHGHVHHHTVPDKRYLNVSVDALEDGKPMPMAHVLEWRDSVQHMLTPKVKE
jgi:calcineurin-like phosphoesterase family protein